MNELADKHALLDELQTIYMKLFSDEVVDDCDNEEWVDEIHE